MATQHWGMEFSDSSLWKWSPADSDQLGQPVPDVCQSKQLRLWLQYSDGWALQKPTLTTICNWERENLSRGKLSRELPRVDREFHCSNKKNVSSSRSCHCLGLCFSGLEAAPPSLQLLPVILSLYCITISLQSLYWLICGRVMLFTPLRSLFPFPFLPSSSSSQRCSSAAVINVTLKLWALHQRGDSPG